MRKLLFFLFMAPLVLNSQENKWGFFFEGTKINQIIIVNGEKWVSSCSDYGIIKIHDGDNEKHYYSQINTNLPSGCFCGIDYDLSNNIWAGLCYGGIAKYNGNRWSVYDEENSKFPLKGIRDLAVSEKNVLWLGTARAGLVSVFNNQWVTYDTMNSPLPGNLVTSLVFDHYQHLWIGTWEGVVRFNGSSWKVYNSTNSFLPGDEILALQVDNENNIWAGTYKNGVGKFNGAYWISFNSNDAMLLNNPVQCIGGDQNQMIWFGTAEKEYDSGKSGGVLRFDGVEWYEITPLNSPLPSNSVNCIVIDENNNKWFGTNNGLAVYNEMGVFPADN